VTQTPGDEIAALRRKNEAVAVKKDDAPKKVPLFHPHSMSRLLPTSSTPCLPPACPPSKHSLWHTHKL
jgi:hypothetical protein